MPQRMPREIEDKLLTLHSDDDVKYIQQRWNELSVANENYELSYPIQFGNLVDSNLRFKESKTIPTPAEQMRAFQEMILAEIDDLADKEREELYELDDHETPANDNMIEISPQDKLESFKIEFMDMWEREQSPLPEELIKPNDIDKSQILSIGFIEAYQKGQERDDIEKEDPALDKDEVEYEPD